MGNDLLLAPIVELARTMSRLKA